MLDILGTENNSLHFKPFPIPGCDAKVMCDTTTSHIRPFIPKEFRRQVLATVDGLLHSGVQATTKLTTTRVFGLVFGRITHFSFVTACNVNAQKCNGILGQPWLNSSWLDNASVVKALLSERIVKFGVPMLITSHRGRQFKSSIFAELVKTIGATHLHTTPYHWEIAQDLQSGDSLS